MARQKPQIDVATVTDTSKTLSELGVTLRTGSRTTLKAHAVGIYMDDGTASSSSHPMNTDVHEIDGDQYNLDELEFYAASDTKMTVIQEDGHANSR
jgi:hypothetical protein